MTPREQIDARNAAVQMILDLPMSELIHHVVDDWGFPPHECDGDRFRMWIDNAKASAALACAENARRWDIVDQIVARANLMVRFCPSTIDALRARGYSSGFVGRAREA